MNRPKVPSCEGYRFAHQRVTVLIGRYGPSTIVTTQQTGEILAEHTINLDRDYQPEK